MKPTIVLIALAASVLAAAPADAQGSYPENTGAAVTDLAGVLSKRQEDSVRVLLAPVRNRGADVRVVTVESVADHASAETSIETFATGLFNAWRVGDRPENDGTLLLVAVRDRKVRIEVGDGAPPPFDARAQEVIDTRMVPEFRQEDYAAGILAAAGEIARWYVETPAQAPVASAPEVDPFAARPAPATTPQPYYVPPAGGPVSGPGAGFGMVALGVGGMIALMVGGASYSRHRKRKCPSCGTQMTRLDEASDDVHLDSGQRLEEMLSSVDYDVWKCGSCNHHTLLPYTSWFSSHKQCGGCGYRTAQVSRETVDRPTYHSTRLERVTQACRHCGRTDEHMVTLPRLTPPPKRPRASSSSWSGSSGSSSSGGSSWGGSSSGGGSSGGGGRSSGRGASGSW